MGASLSERYQSQQKGTAKMMADHETLRKDLMKVCGRHLGNMKCLDCIKTTFYAQEW